MTHWFIFLNQICAMNKNLYQCLFIVEEKLLACRTAQCRLKGLDLNCQKMDTYKLSTYITRVVWSALSFAQLSKLVKRKPRLSSTILQKVICLQFFCLSFLDYSLFSYEPKNELAKLSWCTTILAKKFEFYVIYMKDRPYWYVSKALFDVPVYKERRSYG